MLFGSDSSSSPFRHLYKSSGKQAAEAMVPFDDRWNEFFDLFPNEAVLAKMTDEEMCGRFGMPASFFEAVVPDAIRQWRVSPSRSFINILGPIHDASVPSGDMFRDIKEQTRILAGAVISEALSKAHVRSVKGPDGKALMAAGDAVAATLTDEGVEIINDQARFLKAWEMRNRAKVATGLVKLPKALYRGVRDGTIVSKKFKSFKEIDGEAWNIRHCRWHESRREILLSKAFVEVSKTPILSFTSSLDIAKTFTFGEGQIVEIDPAECAIVASWGTDEALAGKDYVLNKHEREWIIRPPQDFIPSPEQVSSWDRTFAFSTNDPSGIEMLHHYTEAKYVLDGHRMKAWFRYNSNGRGGRIVFQADREGWGVGRQTLKREKGFDPVPDSDRLAEKLVFSRYSYPGAKTEYFERYEPKGPATEQTRRTSGGFALR